MKILVTGGAGFIGSHLVDALVQRGDSVRVLDMLVSQVHRGGRARYLPPGVDFIRTDLRDPEVIEQALEDIEAVFHLAAEVGVGQSMYEIVRYVGANTFATSVLLETITRNPGKLKKLVVASSMSIYGEGAYKCHSCGVVHPPLRTDAQLARKEWEPACPRCGGALAPLLTSEDKPLCPTSVYAISKQDQEQLSLVVGRAYGIPTVALRFFNVYGARQELSNPYTGVCAIFSSRLLNDRAPTIFEDGRQSRDFIHVSDIVRGCLLALDSDKANYEAVNIGTGTATSVAEVAELLAAGLGKPLHGEMVGRYRSGDIRHCVADISKARRLLGYEPQVRLQDGIPELLDWVARQTAEDYVESATAELEARALIR